MVLVINNAGVPLLTKIFDFTPATDEDAFKPVLIAGFMSAIQAFSKEISSGDNKVLSVDFERQHLLIQKRSGFSIAAIMNSDTAYIRNSLKTLGDLVRESFPNISETHTIDHGMDELFDHYSVITFADRYLKPHWVIEVEDGIELPIEANSGDSVQMLTARYGKDIKVTLLRLLKEGKVNFKMTLNPTSILMPSQDARRYLVSSDEHCTRSNDITLPPCELYSGESCKHILQSIIQPTTVREVTGTGEHRNEFVQCLIDKGLIVELSPRMKQVLKIKKIVNGVFDSVDKVVKRVEMDEAVKGALHNLEEVGFSSEITKVNELYTADMTLNSYMDFTEREMNMVIGKWLDFIRDMILALPNKKIKKLAEKLMTDHADIFIDFYESQYDPRQENFDDFLTFLEVTI